MPALKKKLTRPSTPTTNNSKYQSVIDRIQPVSDLGLVLAALFYGRAGTGKTTLAASFPKPLLHLDIREKGTDSISDMKDVETLSLSNWDDLEQVYWYLESGKSPYKTVALDAVSMLQDFAMVKALEDDGKSEGDLISKRQWGVVSGLMKTWIINYRDLVDKGINVVFLAHDRASEGEEGEEGELMPSVGPRLMPSVAGVLNASVKVIGNTFVRETHEKLEGGKMKRRVQYCMRIGPHAYYATKIRQPKGSYTPDILEDPSYDALVRLMKGEFVPPPTPEPVVKKLKTMTKRK